MPTGQETKKKNNNNNNRMMMMIGFLDGVNVRHTCAARALCQERTEECYECLE
jgi:hypothetical protein